MADPSRRLPRWLDPLGIRGSILDPLALFADAARTVVPASESISWMMTTAARRLEGRRFKTHGDPLIEARVARVREVVPSMSVTVPVVSRIISIWDRMDLTLDSVSIGGRPVTGVEVVASGIGVADPAAQSVLVSHVEIEVVLSKDDIRPWLEDAAVAAELDMRTGFAEVRPWDRAGWLRVVVEPCVDAGRASGRPKAAKVGPVTVPLPSRLVSGLSRHLPRAHESLSVSEMTFPDGVHANVRLVGDDIKLAVDVPRVVTEIGLEGPRTVARILTL